MQTETGPSDTGMSLRDLLADPGFPLRAMKSREPNAEVLALRRLSHVFTQTPESILQKLVDTAVEFCGADSAGISLEEPKNGTFKWIVVAGSFAPYLGGRTPRNYSPCGTCLDSGRAQLYGVTKPYYDHLGVTAKPIIDGMLIPWSSASVRGTLWIVSHSSEEAFCSEDFELLTRLADFASLILQHQHQEILRREAACDQSNAEMANQMAHRLNNPLQSLTNTIFLARQGRENVEEHLLQAEADLKLLSRQVALLLKVSTNPKSKDDSETSRSANVCAE